MNHISEESVPMFFTAKSTHYKFSQMKAEGNDVKVSQNS